MSIEAKEPIMESNKCNFQNDSKYSPRDKFLVVIEKNQLKLVKENFY
jgi:hypothetical protein